MIGNDRIRLHDCFLEYLRSRNIPATVTDNKIMFCIDGISLMFVSDVNDYPFIKIIALDVIHVADIGSDCDQFINYMNTKFKMVKMFTLHGKVCLSIDHLVYSPVCIDKLFDRLVRTITRVACISIFRHSAMEIM